MKKVLILTGSYGSGHNRAARVLEKQLIAEGNQVLILDIVDFLNENSMKSGNITKSFYEDFCEKYKKVWEITFNIIDDATVKRFLYGIKYPIFQSRFDDFVQTYEPDVVLSVFPFWQGFIKHYLKKYEKTFKTGVFITDSINIHSIWYLDKDYIDYYFVIDKLTKGEFIEKFNHTKDNIIVSFFPLESDFFLDREEIKVKNIILLLTSQEENFILDLLEILKTRKEFNINILAGRNKVLFSYVSQFYTDIDNFKFYPFFDIKSELKNIDLVISKPGGAIISECIANDVPVIIPTFIAGQEEGNKLLVELGEVGFFEPDAKKIDFALRYLDFSKFIPNFRKIKNKDSTKIIIDTLMN
ncbi:MAG: glycosyltransferase [Candidatus Gracilibacteria bacterium]|nr:glycosyltransferase [Candidatus Gracilibacteria bacterium]